MRCLRLATVPIDLRSWYSLKRVMEKNAIGPYEDLLTSVKRRKLKWYGHVTRSSGLAKTILQGTVQGGRRRDRGNDGKTTSKSGLALNGIHYYGKLRTARSGGNWLYNLQLCPNGQPDYGIDKIR